MKVDPFKYSASWFLVQIVKYRNPAARVLKKESRSIYYRLWIVGEEPRNGLADYETAPR